MLPWRRSALSECTCFFTVTQRIKCQNIQLFIKIFCSEDHKGSVLKKVEIYAYICLYIKLNEIGKIETIDKLGKGKNWIATFCTENTTVYSYIINSCDVLQTFW